MTIPDLMIEASEELIDLHSRARCLTIGLLRGAVECLLRGFEAIARSHFHFSNHPHYVRRT